MHKYSSLNATAGFFTVAGLVLALAGMPTDAAAEEAADPESPPQEFVDVLSYNIHGLFRAAAKDSPRDRMPSIGWLSRPYEIVLYQEDFEYNSVLKQQLEHHHAFNGNRAAVGDARRILAKIVSVPFTLLIPRFSPPYGSGVSAFVSDNLKVLDSGNDHYDDCYGWFGANGDCWAAKGYVRVSVQTASGARIDVYNTHLEAGPTEESTQVRGKQLEQLAMAIEKQSANNAVIVAGDFNLGYIRPGDRGALAQFRELLGLSDTGAGPETPFWRERDFILYRSGGDTILAVEDSGEALEFTSAGRSLSDHPALFARFDVDYVTEWDEDRDD
jgi:endonuclease/exonuclease/phosphatase family metal-dependent hydrolase